MEFSYTSSDELRDIYVILQYLSNKHLQNFWVSKDPSALNVPM